MATFAKGGGIAGHPNYSKHIRIKPSTQGSYRAYTGTPSGQKIPLARIKADEHSPNPKIRKKAQFADNARKFSH